MIVLKIRRRTKMLLEVGRLRPQRTTRLANKLAMNNIIVSPATCQSPPTKTASWANSKITSRLMRRHVRSLEGGQVAASLNLAPWTSPSSIQIWHFKASKSRWVLMVRWLYRWIVGTVCSSSTCRTTIACSRRRRGIGPRTSWPTTKCHRTKKRPPMLIFMAQMDKTTKTTVTDTKMVPKEQMSPLNDSEWVGTSYP